ncbi:MAG: outer membrane protein transport protein, partial [Gammaproteobacteria bacterium]
MNPRIIKLSKLVLAAAAAGFSTQSFASGFALIEQGASGQGAAYAGAAAIGEDASTVFFNPAAMTRLSGQQIVIAGHIVALNSEYKDSGTSSDATGVPGSLTGTNSDNSKTGFVPNFYWASALDNGLHVGVGVNVPFGLASEYDEGWYGRYHGLKSEITTININPAIAWKVTDTVSLGFGLSYQYVDVELTQNIDSSAACFNLSGSPCGAFSDPSIDSGLKLEGDDSSFGWNVGVLIDVSNKSRLGIAYRSEIKQDIEGDATYNLYAPLQGIVDFANTNPPLAPNFSILSNTSLSAAAQLPETFSLSYVRDINVN